MMCPIRRICVAVFVFLAVGVFAGPGTVWAQSGGSQKGHLQLLIQYDRNGDGVLSPAERAALLAGPVEEETPAEDVGETLICEQHFPGGGGGSASSTEFQDVPQNRRNLFRLIANRRREALPNDAEAEALAEAQEADFEAAPDAYGYAAPQPESPQQPSPPTQFRNAVQYRMQLNQANQQPRQRPYARAATFGPMVGLVKHSPARYARVVEDHCAVGRVSLYVARGCY